MEHIGVFLVFIFCISFVESLAINDTKIVQSTPEPPSKSSVENLNVSNDGLAEKMTLIKVEEDEDLSTIWKTEAGELVKLCLVKREKDAKELSALPLLVSPGVIYARSMNSAQNQLVETRRTRTGRTFWPFTNDYYDPYYDPYYPPPPPPFYPLPGPYPMIPPPPPYGPW